MKTKSNNKRATRLANTLTDLMHAREIITTDAHGFPTIHKGIESLRSLWRKTGKSEQEMYRHLSEQIRKDRIYVKM